MGLNRTFTRFPNGGHWPNFKYTFSNVRETGRTANTVTYSYNLKCEINGFYGYNLYLYLVYNGSNVISIDLTNSVKKVSTGESNRYATFYTGSGSFTLSGVGATGTSKSVYLKTYSSNTPANSKPHDSANYTFSSVSLSVSNYNTAPTLSGTISTGTSSSSHSTATKFIKQGQQNIYTTWPAASDKDGNTLTYYLDVSINGGSYTRLTSTTSTNYLHAVGSYGAGTVFKYRVYASDGMANSATIYSNNVTKNTAPSMSGVIALNDNSSGNILVSHSTTSLKLSWAAASNAGAGLSRYVIQYTTDNSNYNSLTTTTGTSYTHTFTAGEGRTYKYRVYAEDSVGDASGYIYSYIATTNTRPTLSGSASVNPSGVISHTATSIRVTWNAATDPNNNISGYYVDCSKNDGAYTSVGTVTSGTSFNHSFSQGEGNSYQYRISAYDAFGAISGYIYSNKVVTNTRPELRDNIRVSPSGLIHKDVSTITVSWDAATDINSNVSGYKVYCSVNGGSENLIATTTSTSYQHNVSQWGASSTFKYSVEAYDAFDAKSSRRYSSVVTKSTPPTLSGSVSTNPSGVFSHLSSVTSEITLSWGTGTNARGYKVFCSINGGSADLIATIEGKTTTKHNVSSGREGTRYKYSVQAYDQFGDTSNIIYSAEVVKNTSPTLSGSITTSPSGIIAENTTRMNISWPTAQDVDNNLSGYNVYYSIDGGDYKIVTTTTAGNTNCTQTIGGGEGTKFRYQVEAYDVFNGISSRLTSAIVTKNTLTPGSITNVEQILFETSSINVQIKAGSNTSGITPTYKLYSDNITVYNQAITGSTTLTIHKSGTAPSTPYIKFNDLINLVRSNKYIGSFNLTLETNSTTGTVKRMQISVPVNLQTKPIAPTSVTINSSKSTCIKNFNNNSYYVPDSKKTVHVQWNEGVHPLGGTFEYVIYANLGGTETLLATVNSSTRTYNYIPEKLNYETKNLKFKIKIKPTDYPMTASKESSSITLHYYEKPSGALVDRVIRSASSATAKVLIKPITSIPNIQTSGTWVCKPTGSNTQTASGSITNSQSVQNIVCGNLTENGTYTLTITYNDNTGWTTNQTLAINIGANLPMVFINQYGLGVGGYKANANYSTNIYGNVNIVGTINPKSSVLTGTSDYAGTPDGLSICENTNQSGWHNSLSTILHVRANQNRQFQIECSNGGSTLCFRAGHSNNTGGTANGFSSWKEIIHSGNVSKMSFMTIDNDESLRIHSVMNNEDNADVFFETLTDLLDTIDIKVNKDSVSDIGINANKLSSHPLYKFICENHEEGDSIKLIPLIISLVAGYKQEKEKRENLESIIKSFEDRISKLEK